MRTVTEFTHSHTVWPGLPCHLMQTVAANSTAHLCYFAASHTLSTTAWSESATVAAGLLRGVRALLGGKTYLEKAGLLVAHPGAEAQRWHMDNPHLYAIPTHLPPHSLTVFVALCELTAANGPTEFHLATHVKAHLAAPRRVLCP